MAHGTTWAAQADAFLDEISRRDHDRQTALDSLHDLIREHPDLETNTHLTVARLALLR